MVMKENIIKGIEYYIKELHNNNKSLRKEVHEEITRQRQLYLHTTIIANSTAIEYLTYVLNEIKDGEYDD